jgi:hypothetical protein
MSKNEKLKKNPVRPLSPLAMSETFSILRIPIELVFGESEYRLKQHCVSSFAKTKRGRSYNYAFLLKPAEILLPSKQRQRVRHEACCAFGRSKRLG